MKTRSLARIIGSVIFWGGTTLAQLNNSQNVGLPSNGSFEGSSIESVQVNNGNLHVEIPLFTLAGRGLPLKVSYVYDTKGWWGDADPINGSPTAIQPAKAPSAQAWLLSAPLGVGDGIYFDIVGHAQCNGSNQSYFSYRYVEQNGTSHPFPVFLGGCRGRDTIYANDGSGYAIQFGQTYTKGIRKDGVSTYYDGSSQYVMEDTNGNKITRGNTASSITDTLGRSIPIAFVLNPSSGKYELSYYDSSGTQQTIKMTPTPVSIHTSLCSEWNNGDGCNEYIPSGGTWSLPQEIDLPDGTKYTMEYNSGFGTLSSITLPTGATIGYTYGAGGANGYKAKCVTSGNTFDLDDSGPRVTQRQVTIGTQVSTWNYKYVCGSPAGFPAPTTSTDQAVVTSPLGDDTVHSFTHYVDFNVQRLDTTLPPSYETQTDYYAGAQGGSPLKSVITDYQVSLSDGPHMPIRVTTKWGSVQGHLTSKVETTWDTFQYDTGTCAPQAQYPCYPTLTWGNPKEKKEFDFGVNAPGGQARRTDYDYAHYAGDTNYNSNYASLNIANRMTEKLVYPNTSTTAIADSKMYYDQGSTPTPLSGKTNHETMPTNYRGNLTKTSTWLSPSTWLDTVNTFDDLGHMQTTTDPATNQTSFDYTDQWSGVTCGTGTAQAFLTKTTRPKIGTVNHISTNKYYNCTGQVESSQDENDVAKSRTGLVFTYDSMMRLSDISRSDTVVYDEQYDYSSPPNVTRKALRDTNSDYQTTVSIRDTLGRETSSQMTSDPEGADKVDTTYDADGRKSTVSIPYRGTSTTYVTTYQYDALNRVTQETSPDGGTSNISTSYGYRNSAPYCLTTTVTDQAGKARKSCVDALGHLISVYEDPGTSNYETDYQYDALDNLVSVTQNGNSPSNARNRTFVYDSLSRLISATNPESGYIQYLYTAAGGGLCAGDQTLVCQRIAPLPNQTGSRTATTTYAYDALNRLTAKSYSDGSPTVMFAYDQSAAVLGTLHVSINNYVGRLSWSAPVDSQLYPINMRAFSYDSLGRVTDEWEEPDTTDYEQHFGYGYNPDSTLKSLVYPSGRTLTFTVNGAGRTTDVKDTANSINYVTSAKYDAAADLTSMVNGSVIGGFAGITTTNTYNERLQPDTLKVTTASQTLFSRTYDFHRTAGDNGNVFQITNNLDNNRTQNFVYDHFNRISQAYTTGSNWGEDFTIDAWGNLTNRALHSGKTNYEPLSQTVSIRNQLSGFSYDAAGNITSSGANPFYIYNAENQMISLNNVINPMYFYNAEGERVKKTVGPAGTAYTYGIGTTPFVEADLVGNVTNEYIFFNGKRVARRDGTTGAVEYYFPDHLGSASVITDSSGVVQKEADYYPYGGEIVVSGSDANKYKFTGKERDQESGLDEFGARYFSSNIGRFMIPDWAANPTAVPYANYGNPQSLNLYSYVENNPTTTGDPDGHIPPDGLYHGGDGGFAGVVDLDGGDPTPSGGASGPTVGGGISASTVVEVSDPTPAQNGAKGWWASLTGALAVGVARISPSAARKLWEAANPGKTVPFDALRGRFYDMAHTKALADGGTNAAENLKPQEHGEHIAEHMANGDFARWAGRAKNTVSDAARAAGREIESDARQSANEIVNDVRGAAAEILENPGEAVRDAATAVGEAIESGEIPPP